MATESLAHTPATFTLYRVFADGREEIVPGTTTTDHIEGIHHGHRMSREEPASAFTLRRDGRAVHKFAHHTLKLRLRPDAIAMMVS